MRRQHRTLAGVVASEGVGLHSGQFIQVVIRPAPLGTGIRFIRADLHDGAAIPAHSSHVTDTYYATTLSVDGISISTVEHLLAALCATGVTNADVQVKGTEVPILDGSSRDWMALLGQVGTVVQGTSPVSEIVVSKPIAVKNLDQWATLYPSSRGFAVDCTIEFPHPLIGHQHWAGEITETSFREEIADARTFGLLKDAQFLLARGRARGANMENTVILDEQDVVSSGGLRFEDEFVRHKVLDAIGDISLLGLPIRGCLVSHKAGHRLHQQLMKVLLESRDCWELSTAEFQPQDVLLPQAKRLLQVATIAR